MLSNSSQLSAPALYSLLQVGKGVKDGLNLHCIAAWKDVGSRGEGWVFFKRKKCTGDALNNSMNGKNKCTCLP